MGGRPHAEHGVGGVAGHEQGQELVILANVSFVRLVIELRVLIKL